MNNQLIAPYASDLSPFEFLEVFLLMVQFIMIIALVVSIAVYVLHGIAYYKLAKARSVKYPWLSWIPFARDYQIGQISDDVWAKKGVKKSRRRLLLTLSIIIGVLSFLGVLMYFVFFVDVIVNAVSEGIYSYTNYDAIDVLTPFFIGTGFFVVSAGLEIWHFVVYCMSHYTIYNDHSPKRATIFTVFTVLALVFGVTFLPAIFVLTLIHKPSISGGSTNTTANTGMNGTANAGMSGTANAGMSGTANAGMNGTANAGMNGTANAGMSGTANTGMNGTANAGMNGTANAGMGGAANEPSDEAYG